MYGCSGTLPRGPVDEAEGLGHVGVDAGYFGTAPDAPRNNPYLNIPLVV